MAVVSDTAGLTTVAAIDSTPFQPYGNAAFGESNFGGKTNLHATTADVSVNSVIKLQRSIAEVFGTVSDNPQKQSVGSVLTSRLFGVTRGTVAKLAFGSVVRTSAIFSTGLLSGLKTSVSSELLSRQIPFGESSYGADTFGGNAKLRARTTVDSTKSIISNRKPTGKLSATTNDISEIQSTRQSPADILANSVTFERSIKRQTTASSQLGDVFAEKSVSAKNVQLPTTPIANKTEFGKNTFGKAEFGGGSGLRAVTTESSSKSTASSKNTTAGLFARGNVQSEKQLIGSVLDSDVFSVTDDNSVKQTQKYNTTVVEPFRITRLSGAKASVAVNLIDRSVSFGQNQYGSTGFGGSANLRAITDDDSTLLDTQIQTGVSSLAGISSDISQKQSIGFETVSELFAITDDVAIRQTQKYSTATVDPIRLARLSSAKTGIEPSLIDRSVSFGQSQYGSTAFGGNANLRAITDDNSKRSLAQTQAGSSSVLAVTNDVAQKQATGYNLTSELFAITDDIAIRQTQTYKTAAVEPFRIARLSSLKTDTIASILDHNLAFGQEPYGKSGFGGNANLRAITNDSSIRLNTQIQTVTSSLLSVTGDISQKKAIGFDTTAKLFAIARSDASKAVQLYSTATVEPIRIARLSSTKATIATNLIDRSLSFGEAAYGRQSFGGSANITAIGTDNSLRSILPVQTIASDEFTIGKITTTKPNVGSVLTSDIFGIQREQPPTISQQYNTDVASLFGLSAASGIRTQTVIRLLSKQLSFGEELYGANPYGGNAKLRAISTNDGNLTAVSTKLAIGAVFSIGALSGKKNRLGSIRVGQIKSIAIFSPDNISLNTPVAEAEIFTGASLTGLQTTQIVNNRQTNIEARTFDTSKLLPTTYTAGSGSVFGRTFTDAVSDALTLKSQESLILARTFDIPDISEIASTAELALAFGGAVDVSAKSIQPTAVDPLRKQYGESVFGKNQFGGESNLEARTFEITQTVTAEYRTFDSAIFALTDLNSVPFTQTVNTQLSSITGVTRLLSEKSLISYESLLSLTFGGNADTGIKPTQPIGVDPLRKQYGQSTFGKNQFGGETNINSIAADLPVRSTVGKQPANSDIFSIGSIQTDKPNIIPLLSDSDVFARTFLNGLLPELRYDIDDQVGVIKATTRGKSIQTTLQTTELPFIPFSDGTYGSGAFGGLTVEKAITANSGLTASIKDSPTVTDIFAKSFIQPVNSRGGNKLIITPEQQLGTELSKVTEDGTRQLPEEYGEFGFGSGAFGGPETRNIHLTRLLPTKRVSDGTVVVFLKGIPAKSAALQQVTRSTENIGTLIEQSNLTTLPIGKNITAAQIQSQRIIKALLTPVLTDTIRTGDIRYIRKRVTGSSLSTESAIAAESLINEVARAEQEQKSVSRSELITTIVNAGESRQILVAEAAKEQLQVKGSEYQLSQLSRGEQDVQIEIRSEASIRQLSGSEREQRVVASGELRSIITQIAVLKQRLIAEAQIEQREVITGEIDSQPIDEGG